MNREKFDINDDTAEIIRAIEEELAIAKRKEYAELGNKFVNFSPGVPFRQFSQFVEKELNNSTRETVHLRATERRNRTKTVHVLMIHNYQKIESETEETAPSD